MRFGSLTVLLALGTAGIYGCGGGGTANGNLPVADPPYDTPASTNNDPVKTADATPSPYDTPPTDYQSPNGPTPPTPGEVCPKICPLVVGVGCLAGDGDQAVRISETDCELGCTNNFSKVVAMPCLGEAIDLFTCFFDDKAQGLTCELVSRAVGDQADPKRLLDPNDLMDLGQEVLTACGDELTAYSKCVQAHQPANMQPDNGCDGTSCGGCNDNCLRCQCDANPGACMRCTNM